MRHLVPVVVSLLLAGCETSSLSPQADSVGPTRVIEYAQQPGPYNFDCDAPTDHYQAMYIRSPGGKVQVSGSFRFLTDRGVSHTYPFVNISLVSPARQSAVSLTARVTNSDAVRFSLGNGKALVTEFTKEAFTGGAIPFVLTVDQAGKVTGSIDNIPVPGGRNAADLGYLMLTCSTAHVRFSNVTLMTLD